MLSSVLAVVYSGFGSANQSIDAVNTVYTILIVRCITDLHTHANLVIVPIKRICDEYNTR